jgi:hypothetical protein
MSYCAAIQTTNERRKMRTIIILSILSLGHVQKFEPKEYKSLDGQDIAFNIRYNKQVIINVYQLNKSIVEVLCGRANQSEEGLVSAITADERVVQSFILPASSSGWECIAGGYKKNQQRFMVWITR